MTQAIYGEYMELVFIMLLFFSVYSYGVYPPILWGLQKIARRLWKQNRHKLSVSMIISVYNEESVIRAKIENAMALDYPPELLEIIVSSDGSTDSTHNIVAQFKDSRIVLKRFERLGKTECLNRVVPEAHGDIILFTDANSMFPKDLLNNLSSNFIDPDIGSVTGWTKYIKAGGGEDVTGIYAKLEKITKHWESMVSSCVGADGAVFAIRKELYKPLEAADINDFIIPLHVIRQKKRVILDPRVFCYEEATSSDQKTFRRQVRITTRTWWAIRRHLYFMNFKTYGSFAFFLLSHKILRLATPLFLICTFIMNLFLLSTFWFYNLIFLGFILFFILGLINLFYKVDNKIAYICKFFLITLSAQFIGWIRMVAGIKDKTWTPQR
jgi:cellulose synthase/poly-beta-1,6-N-acetylglucosamine synthase-like glycosyltransferase